MVTTAYGLEVGRDATLSKLLLTQFIQRK